MLLDVTVAGVSVVVIIGGGCVGVGVVRGAAKADETLHGAVSIHAPLRLSHVSEALAGGGEAWGGEHGGRDRARRHERGNAAGALGPDDEGGGVAWGGGLGLAEEVLAVVGVGVGVGVVILEPAASLGAVLHLEVAEGGGLVADAAGVGVLALPATVGGELGVGRREEGLLLRGGGVVGGGGRRCPPHGKASGHHLAGIHAPPASAAAARIVNRRNIFYRGRCDADADADATRLLKARDGRAGFIGRDGRPRSGIVQSNNATSDEIHDASILMLMHGDDDDEDVSIGMMQMAVSLGVITSNGQANLPAFLFQIASKGQSASVILRVAGRYTHLT